MAEVGVVEVGVVAALGHQRVVRALLDDLAVGHHKDAVGVAHGGEPAGDDDRGPVLHQGLQPRLDLHLGEGIDAGGRLVQDEDGRVLEQDARQRYQLPLAHREVRAALAHVRRQAVGEIGQPIAVRDALRRPADRLVAGLRAPVADVIGHAAGEEERLLGHYADLLAILLQIQPADVPPIDEQLAALELVEARDEARHAALARARVPDQGQRLAGRDLQPARSPRADRRM